MARPQKNNADYFPHDANMRDDRRIKALRTRHGLEGYAVWCILLEILTDADNFTLPWDTLNQELVAGDIGIDANRLTEIVRYMHDLQLIQHNPETQQLYTTRHHERMRPILDERERKRQWKQEQHAKATSKTPAQEISDVENAQSKVKESKVKESKLNPSIEGESNAHAHEGQPEIKKTATAQNNAEPTTPPQPSTAAGGAVTDIYAAINEYCNTDHGLRELIAWKKQAGYSDRTHGPTTGEVTKFISKYLDRIRATDPVQYFRDNFPAWIVRATEYNRPKKDTTPKYEPPPPHHRSAHRTNGNAHETHISDLIGKTFTKIT